MTGCSPHWAATPKPSSSWPGPIRPPHVAPWRFPASAEEVPETQARELYDDRWMFHGPRFQGVTELTAVGERHVRAVLTTPAAPGALLDNVGQVLGYWIMSRLPERTTVFPVAMREIRFHGPHPAPGERLECLVKITSLTGEFLDADMQLVHNGQVWAEFTGWRDRRFDSNPEIRQADRTPERSTLSKEQPGGWALVHEQWPDLATRELIMRNYLMRPGPRRLRPAPAARPPSVAARPDRGEGRRPPVPLGARRTRDVPGRAEHRQRRRGPPLRDRRVRPGAA